VIGLSCSACCGPSSLTTSANFQLAARVGRCRGHAGPSRCELSPAIAPPRAAGLALYQPGPAVYLMLFNPAGPRTSTYCVLGPAIGFSYAQSMVRGQRGPSSLPTRFAIAAAGSYSSSASFFSPPALALAYLVSRRWLACGSPA